MTFLFAKRYQLYRFICFFFFPFTRIVRIPPKQLYWTYCMGMMGANINTAIKMYNQYKQSNDTNNLKYMSCARNYDVLTFYLDLLVTKDRVYLKLEDRNNFYYQMVEQHAYDERVFDLLLKDFNILSQM